VLYGPNPAHGIFNQNIFLHPGLKIYMEFPKTWTYLNESSTAGGYSEGQKDIALIMRAGRDRQIDTLIENFVNGYYAQTRQQPQSDKQIKMKGREGSELILPRPNSNEILYTLWFKKDGNTFVILATGQTSRLLLYREIGLSFRDLTQDDYSLIYDQELLTVKAVKNETLKDLSKRSDNSLDPKLTELINEVSESKPLPEGEPVRIAIRKLYKRN
jgi:predicted Zn-dependent protease